MLNRLKLIICFSILFGFMVSLSAQTIKYRPKTKKVENKLLLDLPIKPGPVQYSKIPVSKETSIAEFSQESSVAIAIYLTDDNSNWLGLVQGFKAHGIPFFITKDINIAIKHEVVFVYPGIFSDKLSFETYTKLSKIPTEGGVLIAASPQAPSFYSIFGFDSYSFSDQRYYVNFNTKNSYLLSDFQDENKLHFRFADPRISDQSIATLGFINTEYKPIACYEDGSAAISRKIYHSGVSYAFGFDLGYFTLLAINNKDNEAQESLKNNFAPGIDLIYHLIAKIYENHSPFFVKLGTVPYNKRFTAIFTHNLQTAEDFANGLVFADLEQEYGIKGSFFIQTKYISDGSSKANLSPANLKYLDGIYKLGMDIGSYGVSHTPFFNELIMGNGKEQYPGYRPYVASYLNSFNESLLGELRVSSHILESLYKPIKIRSFRSIYDDYSSNVPQALLASNYHTQSTLYANNVLSHLPYSMMFGKNYKQILDLYEIPISFDDKDINNLSGHLSEAFSLSEKIAKYGASVVFSITPDKLDEKLDFVKYYLEQYVNDAFFASITDFGNFWRARNNIQIDVSKKEDEYIIHLVSKEPIKGLSLQIPKAHYLSSKEQSGIYQEGNSIIINYLHGKKQISIRKY